MAEQYAPIAKDESFNTTDLTPKNIADVLQDGLATLANSVKPTADEIPFDNTGTSLVSTDVEGAIKELALPTAKNGITGVTYYEIGKIVIATLNSLTVSGDNISLGLPATNRSAVMNLRDIINGNLATLYFDSNLRTFKAINFTDGNSYSGTFVYVKT